MTLNTVEILLVEDSMDDAELAIRALRKNNLANNLIHVKDGEEALEFIFTKGRYTERNSNIPLKLILLDLHMPKINGLDVLKQIKSNEQTKKYPVVILTSSKENKDIEKCYELGANSYIVKPVDFDNFSETISKLGLYWLEVNQPPA